MTIIFEAMELKDSTKLINIKGRVYRLSRRDYQLFMERKNEARNSSAFTNDWCDLLHWVEENGKYVCCVESFNY